MKCVACNTIKVSSFLNDERIFIYLEIPMANDDQFGELILLGKNLCRACEILNSTV